MIIEFARSLTGPSGSRIFRSRGQELVTLSTHSSVCVEQFQLGWDAQMPHKKGADRGDVILTGEVQRGGRIVAKGTRAPVATHPRVRAWKARCSCLPERVCSG